jgi:hypothetical protein
MLNCSSRLNTKFVKVESLYDSLSDYFSTGQRNRSSIDKMKQSGTDEEDQASTTSNEKNSIDDEDTGVIRGNMKSIYLDLKTLQNYLKYFMN